MYRPIPQVNYVGQAANLYSDAGYQLSGTVHCLRPDLT